MEASLGWTEWKAPLLLALEQLFTRFQQHAAIKGPELFFADTEVVKVSLEVGQGVTELYLVLSKQGISTLGSYEGEPTASLSGTPLAMISSFKSKKSKNLGDLSIEGDALVFDRLTRYLSQGNVDIEALLSQSFGDLVAYKMTEKVSACRNQLNNKQNSVAFNLSEYLIYEKALFPDRFDLNQFTQNVHAIRNDVARIDARIERLLAQAKLGN